jgi:metal-sulfur cluster biosynthetic enzyme
MTITRETVLDLLDRIIDPCAANAGAPGGIVEMGLVRRLEIDERDDGAHVHLGITVTEPTCIMYHSFVRDAHELLSRTEGVAEVSFELPVYESWTEHDMSPELQRRLADARARRNVRVTTRAVDTSGPDRPVTFVGRRL